MLGWDFANIFLYAAVESIRLFLSKLCSHSLQYTRDVFLLSPMYIFSLQRQQDCQHLVINSSTDILHTYTRNTWVLFESADLRVSLLIIINLLSLRISNTQIF